MADRKQEFTLFFNENYLKMRFFTRKSFQKEQKVVSYLFIDVFVHFWIPFEIKSASIIPISDTTD